MNQLLQNIPRVLVSSIINEIFVTTPTKGQHLEEVNEMSRRLRGCGLENQSW